MLPTVVLVPTMEQRPTEPLSPLHHEVFETQNTAVQVPLRRSTRERRPAIHPDYISYLGESDYDIGHVVDPNSFSEAVSVPQSELWWEAMRDEMQSMRHNNVWELVELPPGCKLIGCKWVYKTK